MENYIVSRCSIVDTVDGIIRIIQTWTITVLLARIDYRAVELIHDVIMTLNC